jgi:hypothetical protein
MAANEATLPRVPAQLSAEEMFLVERILAGFAQARTRRYNFETQWQESALLAWPEWANTFFYGYDQMPGQKKTMQQIDSSVSIASHRFGAIVDSLMTPSAIMWSRLRHPDKYLMKQRGVKQYFEELSNILWRHRYDPSANFVGQNQQNMQGLGVFGNMNLYIDALDSELFGGKKGLRYCSIPVGQMYYVQNHQGQVDSFYRTFRWTARQFYQRWPDTFPEALRPALEARSGALFWGVQFVCPRSDWQPWRIDKKGKRWASYYVALDGRNILEEGGYRTFPLAVGRYMQAPDEDYGRGPMQMVLPSAKTKNAEKSVFLKQGHRAGDPIYLTVDDAMMDYEFYPGAVNRGGLSSDGKRQIDILPTGQIQITKEMMDEEGQIIDDAFLVTLFKLALKMEESPNQSARQVVEMIEQRGMFLAPTVGRQQTEYLGSLIPREIDVLRSLSLLPALPDVMKEAKAQVYDIVFTNPLSRAMRAGESAAFMQMVEMTTQIAQSTGDAEVWDNYDFDTALPEMADNRGVPASWLADEKMLAKKRASRAQAAKQDADTKQMPARAAIMKAQAIVAKAQTGGNTGGTLSGTPAGGMPQVPGNPAGMPGQPGIGGGPGMPGQPG